MAPNFETAKQRYESMAADGTAAHSADAWRTMAAALTDAAAIAPAGVATSLTDRADDCTARAARVTAIRNYRGVCGAGFTSQAPERTLQALAILRREELL